MKLVSPLQEVIELTGSIEEFAKANGLEKAKLMALLQGTTKTNTYKGWKNYDLVDKVIDPKGNVLEILGTKKEFALAHNLVTSGITILTKHKRAYKNWKPYIEENENV